MCQTLLFVASADQARAASKAKADEWMRMWETIKRERAQAHATRVADFIMKEWSEQDVEAIDQDCQGRLGQYVTWIRIHDVGFF